MRKWQSEEKNTKKKNNGDMVGWGRKNNILVSLNHLICGTFNFRPHATQELIPATMTTTKYAKKTGSLALADADDDEQQGSERWQEIVSASRWNVFARQGRAGLQGKRGRKTVSYSRCESVTVGEAQQHSSLMAGWWGRAVAVVSFYAAIPH